MKGLLALPVLLVTGLLASTATAQTSPRLSHTPAGDRLAQRPLLKQADLGRGWTATPARSKVGVRLSCSTFRPKQNDLVEVGAAESAGFRADRPGGPFVSQRVSIFANAAQATRLWSRAAKPGLATCIAQDLRASFASRGVQVTINSRRMLPFPPVTQRRAYYRVIGMVTTGQQRLRVYFDVVLVSRGRTVTVIVVSQYQTAPTQQLERRLAQAVARRLG